MNIVKFCQGERNKLKLRGFLRFDSLCFEEEISQLHCGQEFKFLLNMCRCLNSFAFLEHDKKTYLGQNINSQFSHLP